MQSSAEDDLDEFIASWPLPARLLKWARRRKIATARELIGHHPVDLLKVPSLGQGTVAKTRLLIESRFGLSWEGLRAKIEGGYDTSLATALRQTINWGELESILPEEIQLLPIARVDLPVRMKPFVDTFKIKTIGALVSRSEFELLAAKGIALVTLSEAQDAITEAALHFEATLAPLAADSDWDHLARLLPSDVQYVQLDTLVTPPCISTYAMARGITSIGEFVQVSASDLSVDSHITLSEIECFRVQIVGLALNPESDPEYPSAFSAFRYRVARLDAAQRDVVSRRSGLDGESETLREISENLGLSRGQVRSIEQFGLEHLRGASGWKDGFASRLREVIGVNKSALVTAISEDTWWRELAENSEAFEYLLANVLCVSLRLSIVGSFTVLSESSQLQLDQRWQELRDRAENWNYPVDQITVNEVVSNTCGDLGFGVCQAFRMRLDEFLHWRTETGGERRAVEFTVDNSTEVLAFLGEQSEPVSIDVLESAVGRINCLPEGVFTLGPELLGLARHYPDYEEWQRVLPGHCVQIMEESAPDRQWHMKELLHALQEADVAPAWMSDWHIASVLRRSDAVEYLGRLRAALSCDHDVSSEMNYEESICECLRESGKPLGLSELKLSIGEQAGEDDSTLLSVLGRELFIRLPGRKWGLVERDFPGGSASARVLRDMVVDILEERRHGLTTHQVAGFLKDEGLLVPEVLVETMVEVIGSDPRVYTSYNGNIGLMRWEGARVPSQLEVVDQAVSEHADVMSIADVELLISNLYGVAPSREKLAEFAIQIGATIEGETISRVPRKSQPEAVTSLDPAESKVDPPVSHMTLEEARRVVLAYKAPISPAIPADLIKRVVSSTDQLINEGAGNELVLIEKYIDDRLRQLAIAPAAWVRDLGLAGYAFRRIHLAATYGDGALTAIQLRVVRSALYYLVDRDDIIPDGVPDYGYVDDAHALAYCAGRMTSTEAL